VNEAAGGGSLGRQFNLLWVGQSISNAGDRITLFVIPALMIFALDASAFEVGLIGMAQYLAIPVLALVAGGLVDRWDLRGLLIVCDLLRFCAIAIVPVAYWLGFLSVPLLFCCVVVVSAATVFFTTGYIPAVTAIVPAGELVRANSRLEASRTTAELGGPALAGWLYNALGAVALVVDALTYLFSAACLKLMAPCGGRGGDGATLWSRLAVGIRANLRNPVLRKSTAGTLLANIGGPIFVTQLPVLAYQGLGLSAGTFGTVMSVAAVGSVLGALLAPKVTRWLGKGRMLAWSMVLHSASGLGILFATALPAPVVLALTMASYGCFFAWYNICSQAVRQEHMPVADQAVIVGAYRTVTWGVIPVSVFVGGTVVSLLAQSVDIHTAVTITMVCATVIGISSYVPLRSMQSLLERSRTEELVS
jgi:MFS family permease